MKQFKFLMVALILLMGVSLTSCLGDSDPTVRGLAMGKIINSFPIQIELPGGALKFTAQNSIDGGVYPGEYVYFQYSYNSELQKIDQNTTNIEATITIVEKMTHRYCEPADDKGESYENATIIQIGEGAGSVGMGYNGGFLFGYYDKNTVYLPLAFLLKEASQESLNKHSFSLLYDENEMKAGDTDIVFYLRHNSMETETKRPALSNKLFDISSALAQFENVTGQKPQNIVIYANETTDRTTDALDKKKTDLTKYSVKYPEEFRK